MSGLPVSDKERVAVRNRLARARGQLDAVIRHLDEGGDCMDALNQLVAASKAVDRASSAMLLAGLKCCYSVDGTQVSEEDRKRLEKLYLSKD